MGLAGFDRQLLRCADSGDHVFALRIHQELTVEFVGSGGGVTSEGHACCRTLTSLYAAYMHHWRSHDICIKNEVCFLNEENAQTPLEQQLH